MVEVVDLESTLTVSDLSVHFDLVSLTIVDYISDGVPAAGRLLSLPFVGVDFFVVFGIDDSGFAVRQWYKGIIF